MDGMPRLCITLMERQIIKVSQTLAAVGADKVGSLSEFVFRYLHSLDGWVLWVLLCSRFSTAFFR